jgi:hypothetical protein
VFNVLVFRKNQSHSQSDPKQFTFLYTGEKMQRKNRKWVATAVALYLLLGWTAYRWSISQRLPEGNIFNRIEHEGIRRLAEERAKQAQAPPPTQPIAGSCLSAAGPAFVAARFDPTHVVFIVTPDTETRFSTAHGIHLSATPTKISAPAKPLAPLAGLQELYEPDSYSLHFFPKIVQKTQPGDQWTLNVSPDSSMPVAIERPVIAPIGCSLAIGFLAAIPPEQQSAVDASSREYFVVRSKPVESADPAVNSQIGELPDWKPSRAAAKQIEQQLNDRMKQEVARIDARLLANAGTPGEAAGEFPVGGARPRLKEWIRADQGLAHGEGTLDYDLRAFRLAPDGAPRLFARARWTLANATVFLMTAWFKAESPTTRPVLLSADSSWSNSLREDEATGSLGDRLDFQTVLNEFDADHDGWAELLVHSHQGTSTTIALYLYTDLGLVPMKASLRRESTSPESCLDP